jgi:hypothetical protein
MRMSTTTFCIDSIMLKLLLPPNTLHSTPQHSTPHAQASTVSIPECERSNWPLSKHYCSARDCESLGSLHPPAHAATHFCHEHNAQRTQGSSLRLLCSATF